MRQRFTPNALRTLCLAALCAAVGCASSAQRQAAPGNGISPPGKTQAAVSGKNHVAVGRDLLKRGLLDEAEREFRLAIEADANDLEAIAGLGQVEVARGQYSEGMAHWSARPASQARWSRRSAPSATPTPPREI